MRSASRSGRLAALGLCAVLAAGALAGCSTTQEKAAAQRAEAKRILDARAKRQQRKHAKRAADAEKANAPERESTPRQKGKG